MTARKVLAALTVAVVAFGLYHATLLPGFDFGDTGSFQATVGSPLITPRDGYPLYFAIGDLFLRATRLEPARAMNLASAVEAAIACAVIVLVGAELAASELAGVAAGLLFAVSYTFWSQAVIAEVYALHMLFVAWTLLLLLDWSNHPTNKRLAVFFAAYALGFGNHLSMILLLPAYALFLLLAAPGGWRSVVVPRVIVLALAIACIGSLQYLWNLRTLWLLPDPPHGLAEALARFWFDVTKSDWRETMILRVPVSVLRDRTAMYIFDVQQQFGWAVLLAPLGLVRLLARDWRRAVLMAGLYVVNVAFAFSYNVGDTHVFYLPSHLMMALLFAPGVVLAAELMSPRRVAAFAVGVGVIGYGGLRMYRDYPALDRSADDRPTRVLSDLTAGLDDRNAILLTDLNWQLQNGLSYFAKEVRPEVAYARMPDVLLYAPALIRDNVAVGRNVLLTERARAKLIDAYGPLLPVVRDPTIHPSTVSELVRKLPRGTRYVLTVLKPTRESQADVSDLQAAVEILTGNSASIPLDDYSAVAGLLGERPSLWLGASAPFRVTVELSGVPVDVRMESWLAADTIRRMGFGQVIAAHHHTLIVERGVSFVAFDNAGRPLQTAYGANIFAPQARYLVQHNPSS